MLRGLAVWNSCKTLPDGVIQSICILIKYSKMG